MNDDNSDDVLFDAENIIWYNRNSPEVENDAK